MKTFKVAAAQLSSVFLNKSKSIDKACSAIEEAGKAGAQLIVFPEAFVSGYPDWVWLIPNSKAPQLDELYIEFVENAVSIPDDSTARLCEAAKQAGIHVAIGVNERNNEASGSTLYNTLLFISDSGEILGKHRKLIPTGGERTVWAQGDGDGMVAYDTSIGKIAGLICWENFMPLARTTLYHQGTQILASPTWDKSDNWVQSMQHIAREGGMFVISACMAFHINDIPEKWSFKNSYPEDRKWLNQGHSCIISPKGKILAGPLDSEEGILYADLNFDDILKAKRMFDVEGHYARPDVFDLQVRPNK